jgi:hypothetical protein
MKLTLLKISFLILICFVSTALCQSSPNDLKSKIDAMVLSSYQTASAQFPCKLGTNGKMLKWQKIEECLNEANDRVDWESVTGQLKNLIRDYHAQESELLVLLEKSVVEHALPYDKVFIVKKQKAFLPLSNSLLKFLPENSFSGITVFDSRGKKIGTFSSVYYFEKIGSISGNITRLPLFQYTDFQKSVQSSPDRLLTDSFGVLWIDAATQPGFRLSIEKIKIKTR